MENREKYLGYVADSLVAMGMVASTQGNWIFYKDDLEVYGVENVEEFMELVDIISCKYSDSFVLDVNESEENSIENMQDRIEREDGVIDINYGYGALPEYEYEEDKGYLETRKAYDSLGNEFKPENYMDIAYNEDHAKCLNIINRTIKAIELYEKKDEENNMLSLDDFTKERLSEIATSVIWGLIEDDRENAIEYLKGDLDMSDEELKYFGVEE